MAINATQLAGKFRNFPLQSVAQRVPTKVSSAQQKERQAQMNPFCAPDSLPNPTMWDAQSTARAAAELHRRFTACASISPYGNPPSL